MEDNNILKSLKPKWSKFIPDYIKPTPKQTAFMMLPHREAMYGGAAGSGKILSKDGIVLTPFGFRKNKDLKIGDRINNPDGTTQRIIQLRPWVTLEKWTVRFHDGTSTEVAADHLWLAWRSGKRKKLPNSKSYFGEDAAEVIETRELKKWLDIAIDQEARGLRPNWPLIPVCKEQVFNVTLRFQADIDPYILGMWLGDGHWSSQCSTAAVGITSADHTHMGRELKNYSYSHNTKYRYDFTKESAKKIKAALTRLKLKGTKAATKFIPREFLMGTIETRYAILQGLMDTDGTVDKLGHVSFCSTSKQLAEDTAFLIRSLGGTATLTIKKEPFYRDKAGIKVICKKAYILYIKHPNEKKLFRLIRKKNKCNESNALLNKAVVAIDVGGEITGRCLTVSNPNGLYITNDFIVTHNSIVLSALALQYADTPGYNGIIFRRTLTEAALAGSILDVLYDWLSPRMGKGGDVTFNGQYNTFYFHEYNTQLAIAYIKNEYDHERYKSTSFHFIGFDELTDFAEDQYRFLNRSLRRDVYEGLQIPVRIRSATNPGGLGHVWVKNRFKINKCVTCCGMDDRFRGHDSDRPFIQATLKDNPHIDQSSYTMALNEMGEVDRLRMKEGNWDVSAGARFKDDWFKNRWRIQGAYFYVPQIDRKWHRSSCEVFLTIDVAASTRDGVAATSFRVNQQRSYTVISVWAKTPDNYLIWLDQIRIQAEIPDILHKTILVAKAYNPSKVIVDSQGMGKGVAQMLSFLGLPIDPVPTTSDKIQNSVTAQNRAKKGRIILPEQSAWLDILTGELFTWTGHPHETDDQIDALSNAAIYVQQSVQYGEREFDTQPMSLPSTKGEGWSNGYAAGSYPSNPYSLGEESYPY